MCKRTPNDFWGIWSKKKCGHFWPPKYANFRHETPQMTFRGIWSKNICCKFWHFWHPKWAFLINSHMPFLHILVMETPKWLLGAFGAKQCFLQILAFFTPLNKHFWHGRPTNDIWGHLEQNGSLPPAALVRYKQIWKEKKKVTPWISMVCNTAISFS